MRFGLRKLRRWRRVPLLLGAFALAGFALSTTDVDACGSVLERAGAGAWLAPLPFVLVCLVDAWAWSIVLAEERTRWRRLVPCRMGLEAIALTVPGGAVAADGVAPALLARHAGVAVPEAVGAVAKKKWGTMAGQAVFLLVGGLAGASFCERVASTSGWSLHPGRAIFVAALGMAALSVAAFAVLRGGIAERMRALTARLPFRRTQVLAERWAEACRRTDSGTRRFFRLDASGPFRLALASAAVWCAEAFEVFCLLALLGAHPRFGDVIALEALLGVARSVAFFAPGGLGVQELGYVTFIEHAVDLPATGLGAALVLLRRSRDLVFVLAGYAWMSRGARAIAPTGAFGDEPATSAHHPCVDVDAVETNPRTGGTGALARA